MVPFGANEDKLQLFEPGVPHPSMDSSAAQELGPALEEIDESGHHSLPSWMWDDDYVPLFMRNKRGGHRDQEAACKRRKILVERRCFKRAALHMTCKTSFKKLKVEK